MTKALDSGYVVDVQAWADDAAKDTIEFVTDAVRREGTKAARSMVSSGIALHDGRNAWLKTFGTMDAWQEIQEGVVNDVSGIIRKAVANQGKRIAEAIAEADKAGDDLATIKAKAAEMMGSRSKWRRGLITATVTSAIEGAKSSVYGLAPKIKKTWRRLGPGHACHGYEGARCLSYSLGRSLCTRCHRALAFVRPRTGAPCTDPERLAGCAVS